MPPNKSFHWTKTASLLMHSPGGVRSTRVSKNWRDIYFFVFTSGGFLDVATPVLG